MLERYIKCRQIELRTLHGMVMKQVLPAAVEYKARLAESIKKQKDIGTDSSIELDLLKDLSSHTKVLHENVLSLMGQMEHLHSTTDEETFSKKIATDLMPLSVKIADLCNKIEEIVPDSEWPLPKFYDMLFIR
jgi:glutamine synthetase